VHSRAQGEPIKLAHFAGEDAAFAKADTYADWKFIHSPPAPPGEAENKEPQQ
jgi:hypothetical protein